MLRTRVILWGLLSFISLCVAIDGFSTASAESNLKPPAGLQALQQPAAMPSFNLPTAQGGNLDSATLQGKVVIVRFWATW